MSPNVKYEYNKIETASLSAQFSDLFKHTKHLSYYNAHIKQKRSGEKLVYGQF